MTTAVDQQITYLEAPVPELTARRGATRLRNLLRLNAAFSISTGVMAVIAAASIGDVIDLDQTWLIRVVGLGLVDFAVLCLVVSAMRTSMLVRWSRVVVVNDFGWVAGTVLVVALSLVSTTAAVLLGILGLIVLDFGWAQRRARHRLVEALAESSAAIDESPPIEVVEYVRPSTCSPVELWPVITDHALYAKLALNLKAAEGLTPNGPGLQRSCTDPAGRTWFETCTLWDPGRRFDVNVDTSEYPYPLTLVQGSWSVEPATDESSTILMRFAVQAAPGLAGRLFVVVMHLTARPLLRRIAVGWHRAAARSAARRPLVSGSANRRNRSA